MIIRATLQFKTIFVSLGQVVISFITLLQLGLKLTILNFVVVLHLNQPCRKTKCLNIMIKLVST